MRILTLCLLAYVCVAPPSTGFAALVVADFNDNSAADLQGQGGGTGFGANLWDGSTTIEVVAGDLTSLNYNITQSGTSQFIRGDGSGANQQHRLFDSPMNGEIWFSFLINNSSTNSRVGISFNDSGSTSSLQDAVYFSGTNMEVRRNGNFTSQNLLSTNTTYLIVGKLEPDFSGTNDALKVWFDPDLIAQPNINLITPDFDEDGVSIFLGDLVRIGVISSSTDFISGGVIDSVRFSDTPTAFFDVTGVGGGAVTPEPSTFVLAILSLLGMFSLFRRTRQR